MLSRKEEVLIIAREEFRRQTGRLGYRAFTLLVPVVLLLALVIAPIVRSFTDKETAPDRAGYVDQAGVLRGAEGVPWLADYSSVNAGLQALRRNEIQAFFVVDPSYVQTGRVSWYRKGSAIFASEGLGDQFRAVLASSLVAGQVGPEVVIRVNQPAVYEEFRLGDDGVPVLDTRSGAEEVAEFFVPYIFAILLMISIFTGSGYLLQSVAEEKENRMIEMLVTSVSPFSIMAGKVLALGAAGLLQVAVWFVSALIVGPRVMSQVPDAGDLPLTAALLVPVLAFFLAGYFLFAVVMAGVGAATSSVREATQFSAVIALPNIIPIYGSPLIIDNPDGLFARAMTFIPLTAPTTVMLRLGAGGVPAWELAASLALTIASGIALLWFSARVFRAGLLLYGQRMSVVALWRAIRQAG